MRVDNIPLLFPASTVMNANLTSKVLQVYQLFGYSIQIVFTGTPTGSFKLQASSDPVPQVMTGVAYTPVNWTDVANSTFTVTAAGDVNWNVTDVMYNFVQVVYTDTSGGSSTAIITSSVFNGKGQ